MVRDPVPNRMAKNCARILLKAPNLGGIIIEALAISMRTLLAMRFREEDKNVLVGHSTCLNNNGGFVSTTHHSRRTGGAGLARLGLVNSLDGLAVDTGTVSH